MRVSKSAWPTSGVSSSVAASGDGFLSTSRCSRFTYSAGVCASCETIFTGTDAPYAARSGAISCTRPEAGGDGRAPKSRLRSSSHSGEMSAWPVLLGRPPIAARAAGAIASGSAPRPSTRRRRR
jgi:hypothetical protein